MRLQVQQIGILRVLFPLDGLMNQKVKTVRLCIPFGDCKILLLVKGQNLLHCLADFVQKALCRFAIDNTLLRWLGALVPDFLAHRSFLSDVA